MSRAGGPFRGLREPALRVRRTALITGASSGIGEAFAEEFASHGFDLVLTARREERQRVIAESIATRFGVRVDVVPCDLSAPGAVASFCDDLQRRGLRIDALVNSAGFGAPGAFGSSDWQVCADMLAVLVAAPTELVHRLLPHMLERRCGWILNVASLSGLVGSGSGALYEASKSFAVHLSASLRREVSGCGVHVTAVCPGLTRTEFHMTAGMNRTVAGIPRLLWMEPSAVAREGFAALMAGRAVVVTGRVNRLLLWALRLVPRSLLTSIGRRVTRPRVGSRTR